MVFKHDYYDLESLLRLRKRLRYITAGSFLLLGLLIIAVGCESKTADEHFREGNRSLGAAIKSQRGLSERTSKTGSEEIEEIIFKKAISSYSKALENPSELSGRLKKPCYLGRAEAYYETGQYDKAISDFTKAIELGSERYTDRGLAYYAMGQYEKAISDYDKTLELHPRYRTTYLHRARVYEKLGNNEKFINDLKTAAKLGNSEAMRILESKGIKFESKYKKDYEKSKKASTQETSCYELGYVYGRCSARVMKGLKCDPADDIVIPTRCRNRADTQRGIDAGVRSVLE